jgi:serine/threonine protein kinase
VDIYSWGIMLFELLTASDPEPPTEVGETMNFRPHFERQLSICQAPPEALDLCAKAVSFDPSARGSAADQKDDAFFAGMDWDLLLIDCSEGDSASWPSSNGA